METHLDAIFIMLELIASASASGHLPLNTSGQFVVYIDKARNGFPNGKGRPSGDGYMSQSLHASSFALLLASPGLLSAWYPLEACSRWLSRLNYEPQIGPLWRFVKEWPSPGCSSPMLPSWSLSLTSTLWPSTCLHPSPSFGNACYQISVLMRC